MLSFELTDEQRLLEGTVREWAAREVTPRIGALDRAHQFDRGIFPQMADLGLLGISVPVEYGGAGMDYLCLGLASEELEYVDTSLRVIAQVECDCQVSRLLRMRSGWLKNIGRRNTRETGLAKWFAASASERAAGDAVQIHGANGYSDEYPVGRFYRNCKGAVIYEGTREIHELMQADYVLGYRTDKPARCELPAVEREP